MSLDLGFSVVESLKAVESWIGNINNNMGGAAKVGFKNTRVTMGGSNTAVQQTPGTTTAVIQYAEPSLKVIGTTIDFSQGQVTASSQATHFAIKDRPFGTAAGQMIVGTANFFCVEELTTAGAATGRLYYTRDGEFESDGAQLVLRVGNRSFRVVPQTAGAPAAGSVAPTGTPGVWNVSPLNALIYSPFGSNLFIRPTTLVVETSALTNGNGGPACDTVSSALESSNASVTTLLPELTLAQKMFTAISKVLTVHTQNIDTMTGLIR